MWHYTAHNFSPQAANAEAFLGPPIDAHKVFFIIVCLQETKKGAICLKAFETLEATV